MATPALVFGSLFLLLLLGAALIVVNAVRRSGKGGDAIAERGWTRLPDDADVTAGWTGWPFLAAHEPGRARDVVTGQHQGVHFLSLRWSQLESGRGELGGERERYNIVALRVEHDYPHLSVVRGDHKVHRGSLPPGIDDFEVGDDRFDRRWQTLGDAEFGRAVLTPEVRAAMEEHGHGWAFQPGSITRVTPWEFWAGEDRMIEEIDRLAATMRLVPHEVWRRHGGAPRFLGSLGHG